MDHLTPDPEKVLLIDKPLRWTSFDVVKKLKYHFKLKKIGHAGTLDPLATGLLILCTGKKTKEIDQYMAREKEYTGSFYLGQSTPSHDLETEVDQEWDISGITPERIIAATDAFTGTIRQTPPAHSAIKVKGKRAYEHARKGETLVLKEREVTIDLFEVIPDLPEIKFRVICSKGTYIRSLARDFGQYLGVGAYLSSLRRTRIGEFTIENALTLEEILENENL